MKLSLNWIKDFVDLSGISPQRIAERLSMVTAEVEGFEEKGHNIMGVVVGEIITCVPHPTSKKPLWKLTVSDGKETLPVVCGAPNCRTGMKVVYAKVGSTLGEMQVGKATLAGEESNGMCLSEHELGLTSNHDTIIELDKSQVLGAPIHKVLPFITDTIFEIDNKSLTNRPDLWGHYGFARELAVIFNRKLKPLPVVDLEKYKDLPPVPTKIENPQDCYSLSTLKLENITRKESPLEMKARLFYCDINSHQYLVDLSNYIMLELGQPNHAFDARVMDKVSAGNISVGQFTTLHDQTFDIKPHHMFIKSNGKPVSLAGIIGGANSLVKPDTTSMIFEIATFNPTTIRKTSAELGIRTDSSTRYEKSLDTNMNKQAASRILKLLSSHDKGAKVASSYNWQIANPTIGKTIKLSKKALEKYCGTTFNYADVKRNLRGLGFSPVITKADITVIVPSWRATKDVTLPVDIIEEIARTHGYDNIQPTAPKVVSNPCQPLPRLERIHFIKDLLSQKYALNEIHTYYWNDARAMRDLKIETPSYIKVINSVAQGCDEIRSELIPSLIQVVQKNRQQESVRIFEIGKVFRQCKCDTEPGERELLGIAIASKTKSGEELYKELAHIFNDLFDMLGVKMRYNLGASLDKKFFHPKNNAGMVASNISIGKIGIVHPTTSTSIDPKLNIATGTISLDILTKVLGMTKSKSSTRPSKFPKTTLDFTITTPDVYGKLEAVVDQFTHPLLVSYRLKDIYQRTSPTSLPSVAQESCATTSAKLVPVSYTLQLTIASHEKTLTTDEIQSFWHEFVTFIKNNKYSVDNT